MHYDCHNFYFDLGISKRDIWSVIEKFACGRICDQAHCEVQTKESLSMFHRAFFNSIIDKTPTHALFNQHCISLVC